jgi:hypothetical protein
MSDMYNSNFTMQQADIADVLSRRLEHSIQQSYEQLSLIPSVNLREKTLRPVRAPVKAKLGHLMKNFAETHRKSLQPVTERFLPDALNLIFTQR